MLTKCIWCGIEDIKVKKTMLGQYCQQYLRNNGTLPEDLERMKKKERRGAHKKDKVKFILGITKKYGGNILDDFIELSENPLCTLESVGKKYNFTREYARQLFEKIFEIKYSVSVEKKSKKWENMKNKDINLACVNDPSFKIAEHKKSSKTYQGALIEKKFIGLCQKHNFDIKIPCDSVTDLKINGYNVEVKSNGSARLTAGAKTKRYNFFIGKNQFNKADFFACYHNKLDTFFIIPKESVNPKNTEKGVGISFLREKSDHKCAKNRYWEFKDSWHLLK